MIPLLDRPHPTQLSDLYLNGERNGQVFSAGKGTQQWIICPPSPTSLYAPPAPLPLPLFSLSALSHSHGASGAWSPGPPLE